MERIAFVVFTIMIVLFLVVPVQAKVDDDKICNLPGNNKQVVPGSPLPIDYANTPNKMKACIEMTVNKNNDTECDKYFGTEIVFGVIPDDPSEPGGSLKDGAFCEKPTWPECKPDPALTPAECIVEGCEWLQTGCEFPGTDRCRRTYTDQSSCDDSLDCEWSIGSETCEAKEQLKCGYGDSCWLDLDGDKYIGSPNLGQGDEIWDCVEKQKQLDEANPGAVQNYPDGPMYPFFMHIFNCTSYYITYEKTYNHYTWHCSDSFFSILNPQSQIMPPPPLDEDMIIALGSEVTLAPEDINKGATEVMDGVDNNCSGHIDDDITGLDNDYDGFISLKAFKTKTFNTELDLSKYKVTDLDGNVIPVSDIDGSNIKDVLLEIHNETAFFDCDDDWTDDMTTGDPNDCKPVCCYIVRPVLGDIYGWMDTNECSARGGSSSQTPEAVCGKFTESDFCNKMEHLGCASCINPGATELCDGIDNDCDNRTDESITRDSARNAICKAFASETDCSDNGCVWKDGDCKSIIIDHGVYVDNGADAGSLSALKSINAHCEMDEQCVVYGESEVDRQTIYDPFYGDKMISEQCIFKPGGIELDGINNYVMEYENGEQVFGYLGGDVQCGLLYREEEVRTTVTLNQSFIEECLPTTENKIISKRYGELDFTEFEQITKCKDFMDNDRFEWHSGCVIKDKCMDGVNNDKREPINDILSKLSGAPLMGTMVYRIVDPRSLDCGGSEIDQSNSPKVPLADADDPECYSKRWDADNDGYGGTRDGFCKMLQYLKSTGGQMPSNVPTRCSESIEYCKKTRECFPYPESRFFSDCDNYAGDDATQDLNNDGIYDYFWVPLGGKPDGMTDQQFRNLIHGDPRNRADILKPSSYESQFPDSQVQEEYVQIGAYYVHPFAPLGPTMIPNPSPDPSLKVVYTKAAICGAIDYVDMNCNKNDKDGYIYKFNLGYTPFDDDIGTGTEVYSWGESSLLSGLTGRQNRDYFCHSPMTEEWVDVAEITVMGGSLLAVIGSVALFTHTVATAPTWTAAIFGAGTASAPPAAAALVTKKALFWQSLKVAMSYGFYRFNKKKCGDLFAEIGSDGKSLGFKNCWNVMGSIGKSHLCTKWKDMMSHCSAATVFFASTAMNTVKFASMLAKTVTIKRYAAGFVSWWVHKFGSKITSVGAKDAITLDSESADFLSARISVAAGKQTIIKPGVHEAEVFDLSNSNVIKFLTKGLGLKGSRIALYELAPDEYVILRLKPIISASGNVVYANNPVVSTFKLKEGGFIPAFTDLVKAEGVNPAVTVTMASGTTVGGTSVNPAAWIVRNTPKGIQTPTFLEQGFSLAKTVARDTTQCLIGRSGGTAGIMQGMKHLDTVCGRVVDSPVMPGCFLAGTKVLMGDGSYESIENIKVGDNVIAYDIYNNKPVNDSVSNIFVRNETEYLIIEYEVLN
ncbi:MAG: hypothetical protein ISS36_03970 [Candidatus Aenigmarchaeota archaeon]|nr:hypothetical protein [Candidatus Aenigmarchaeota archaeon]